MVQLEQQLVEPAVVVVEEEATPLAQEEGEIVLRDLPLVLQFKDMLVEILQTIMVEQAAVQEP